jgi:hypothetical protein
MMPVMDDLKMNAPREAEQGFKGVATETFGNDQQIVPYKPDCKHLFDRLTMCMGGL